MDSNRLNTFRLARVVTNQGKIISVVPNATAKKFGLQTFSKAGHSSIDVNKEMPVDDDHFINDHMITIKYINSEVSS